MAKGTISVTKMFEFEAAHFLPGYNGACAKMHGHSYKLAVTLSGEVNRVSGMVTDFKNLKRMVEDNIIKVYDHTVLNDFFSCPTAEYMVAHIANVLEMSTYQEYRGVLTLDKVSLWETSNSCATWERSV